MTTYCGERRIKDGPCTYECGMVWSKKERLQCDACRNKDQLDLVDIAGYARGYRIGFLDGYAKAEKELAQFLADHI